MPPARKVPKLASSEPAPKLDAGGIGPSLPLEFPACCTLGVGGRGAATKGERLGLGMGESLANELEAPLACECTAAALPPGMFCALLREIAVNDIALQGMHRRLRREGTLL